MSIRKAYRTILEDSFPGNMTVTIGDSTLTFTKKTWTVTTDEGAVTRGLRYGENPDQPAALYEWTAGTIEVDGRTISPRRGLTSSLTEDNFLNFGKHPGKINLTDLDSGVEILARLAARPAPAAVILKHNNPCGVAFGENVADAYERAYFADRIAAMGGCVVVNRAVTRDMAELLAGRYTEVLAAPDFEEGTLEILGRQKNLRIVRMEALAGLESTDTMRLDFKTLSDGGIIVQVSQENRIRTREDLTPAVHERKGVRHETVRLPTDREYDDLLFAWWVVSGVTSNSIVMARDGVTTAIGTGEQDRVGAVRLAVHKAYTKYADVLAFRRHSMSIFELEQKVASGALDARILEEIRQETAEAKGGLAGSVIASDGFFPFRDGVDEAVKHGITAVVQPGGSVRDWEVIDACNGYEPPVAMVFTGQRVFRH